MKDDFTFGGWLKRRRGGLGLTQKELAKQVGYAEVTLRKVEADEMRPSRQMAERLAEVLQIAPEEKAYFVRFARDEIGWDNISIAKGLISTVRPYSSMPLYREGTTSPDKTLYPRLPLAHPPRTEHFQGRSQELTQLLIDLQPGCVVTLCGPGGIGKTALATEAIWQLAPDDDPPDRFPDGIFFHSFYNKNDSYADIALEKIARFFGETEIQPTPSAAAETALMGKKALLVFDGAEQTDNLEAVLRVRNQCGVLVTSRKHEDAITEWQDVSPLPFVDAIALLQAWSKEYVSDEHEAERICLLVGNLPLAIRLIGSYLVTRRRSAKEYLQWMEASPLVALDQGKRQARSIPLLLERSLAQVSEQACQVISVVGVLAFAPFTADSIIAVLSLLPSFEILRSIDELVNYSLLLYTDGAYEVTHALIHTYAKEYLAPDMTTVSRLASYYTNFIHNQWGDWIQLNRVHPHIMALLQICFEYKAWTVADNLACSIEGYLDLQGRWIERITTSEIGVAAAQAQEDRHSEGVWLGNLGSTYRDMGQYQKAIVCHERAFAIARAIGNHSIESVNLGNLGRIHRNLGQYQTAINYFKQAITMAGIVGDKGIEGILLGNLGLTYESLGQYQTAIECLEQALTISRIIGDKRNEGSQLGFLGIIYLHLGQYETAIEYYKQALTISRIIGDKRNEGNQLGHLGNACYVSGQIQQALEYYEQALMIARYIGYKYNEGVWLNHLGLTYAALGQHIHAIKYYEQSLLIARNISAQSLVGGVLGNLGRSYLCLGEYQTAIEYTNQALAISHSIDHKVFEANNLCILGRILAEQGDGNQAIKFCQQSLMIKQKIGDQVGEGEVLNDLGYAFYVVGNLSQAIEFQQQAIIILRKLGYRQPLPYVLLDLGETCHALHRVDQAHDHWQEALSIAQEIGDQRSAGEALAKLGRIYRNLGQVQQARHYWERSLIILDLIKAPLAISVREWLSLLDI